MTEQANNVDQDAILRASVNRVVGPLSEEDRIDLGMALFTQGDNLFQWVKEQERFSGILSLFDDKGALHDATISAMTELIYQDQM